MKTDPVFFCDIAPIVPVPLGKRQVFSYLSGTDIPRGSLVSIPFGPRTIRGIVLSCAAVRSPDMPSGRFKHVKSVLRDSFLTDEQISLAESVSRECLTPFGRTLKHFLPDIVRERSGKKKADPEKKTAFHASPDEQEASRILAESSDGRPFFLETDIPEALRLVATTKRLSGTGSQMLVLVPETLAVPFVERFFVGHFGSERTVSIHGALAKGSLFSSWERIRSGKADIVIGTRQALFSPFPKLGLVAILEEAETVGYKQWDMSPRYDARRVATSLAALHGATLLFSGSVAGIDIGLSERLGEIRVLRIGDESRPPSGSVSMVDMRRERWKKNRSIFSEELRERIAENTRNGRKTVLIASRGGLDSFSVCSVCKEIPRCPKCDRALRTVRDGGFRCPSCSYRTESFPRCPKCGSLEWKNIGSGTEKIAREAERSFGKSVVIHVDETAFRKADRGKTYDTLLSADILVGTPAVLNIGRLPDTSLVAILDADNFLSFPDFRADERFLRTVGRSAIAVGGSGTVVIQAFRPERETLRHIAEKTLPELLRKTASDRESLRYPPYSRVFRIDFRDVEESLAEKSAEECFQRFSKAPDIPETVRTGPPMKPLVPKVRGRHVRTVLVTVPKNGTFPEAFERILLENPKSWAFDPDPHSMI